VREERSRKDPFLPVLMMRGVVNGDWNTTRLYMLKVFDKDFIVLLHFLNRFITNYSGYVLPSIWGVFIVQGKCAFELLVLHACPRRRVMVVGVVVVVGVERG